MFAGLEKKVSLVGSLVPFIIVHYLCFSLFWLQSKSYQITNFPTSNVQFINRMTTYLWCANFSERQRCHRSSRTGWSRRSFTQCKIGWNLIRAGSTRFKKIFFLRFEQKFNFVSLLAKPSYSLLFPAVKIEIENIKVVIELFRFEDLGDDLYRIKLC